MSNHLEFKKWCEAASSSSTISRRASRWGCLCDASMFQLFVVDMISTVWVDRVLHPNENQTLWQVQIANAGSLGAAPSVYIGDHHCLVFTPFFILLNLFGSQVDFFFFALLDKNLSVNVVCCLFDYTQPYWCMCQWLKTSSHEMFVVAGVSAGF